MTLPDNKIQADFAEKPLAGKVRASDGAIKLDVDLEGSALPAGIATEAKQDVGNASMASIDSKLTDVEDNTQPATASTVYNVTLTVADTEYSQALPANTRQFRFRCRTAFAVRFAFVTGKVATPTAPYLTLPSGGDYYSDENKLGATTLYLASSEAGVVVELECWT